MLNKCLIFKAKIYLKHVWNKEKFLITEMHTCCKGIVPTLDQLSIEKYNKKPPGPHCIAVERKLNWLLFVLREGKSFGIRAWKEIRQGS